MAHLCTSGMIFNIQPADFSAFPDLLILERVVSMIARTKAFRFGCPLCTIIPSHMMSRLATSEDPDLAAAAARTLRITTTMQAFRAQLTTGALPATAAKRVGLRRQVFDCKTFADLPGDLARSEGDNAVQDPAVNQAYDYAGTTWNFYNQIFNRQSVDDHGRTLV